MRSDGDYLCDVCCAEFYEDTNVLIHGNRVMCITCAGRKMNEHKDKLRDLLDEIGNDPDGFDVMEKCIGLLEDAVDN